MTSVSILGNGAWGTALALTALRAGNKTILWGRDPLEIKKIKELKENKKYLPDIPLPPSLWITSALEDTLKSNIILLTCPAQSMRSFLQSIQSTLSEDAYLVICSKGIEIESGKLMSQVVTDILPNHCYSVLSGPTFAQDVAQERPTAITLASKEITTARWLASSLSCSTFRVYPTSDVIGVEVGGALKNVIAIAVGIATARGLGESTRASLITRGLAEISRLGIALGAHTETFLGLSGVGDVVLTSTSPQSRNMSCGLRIGKAESIDSKTLPIKYLTEGVFTAKAVLPLAHSKGIELPIIESVYRILYEQVPIEDEITALLLRPPKIETS